MIHAMEIRHYTVEVGRINSTAGVYCYRKRQHNVITDNRRKLIKFLIHLQTVDKSTL